ncbi:MAG: hypothetical protein L0170_09190 [Acidobacteria bacterium]|nr:hypothetical protein [Acidobacteriota bacterium]
MARRLRRLLRGAGPEEILARISPDDPLRLYEIAASRLRERFLLIEPEHAHERLLVRLAFIGPQTPEADLSLPWVLQQADLVIQRLLDEEREEERKSPFDCDPEDERHRHMRAAFLVEGRFARTASFSFNNLPERARRSFFLLLLENRSVEDCLGLGFWEKEELRRDIWRCLGALGYPDPQGRPDPNWQRRP